MPSYSFSREELLSLVLYIESGFPSLMAKKISPERGKELFWSPEKGCATCHSVSQEGGDFGPPLDFLRGKSPEDVKKILKEVGQVSGNFLSFTHGEYFSRLSPEELKILVNYLAGFSP
jgi:mono/diheme cytochrome c family protein